MDSLVPLLTHQSYPQRGHRVVKIIFRNLTKDNLR